LISTRYEYLFILSLYGATGLTITWDGFRRGIRKPHVSKAIAIFLSYCFGIEVIALRLGWWTFDPKRVVGVYAWRIPLEECCLFLVFVAIVVGAWETMAGECN
jgi:lycopene cyclase domain-containing protein